MNINDMTNLAIATVITSLIGLMVWVLQSSINHRRDKRKEAEKEAEKLKNERRKMFLGPDGVAPKDVNEAIYIAQREGRNVSLPGNNILRLIILFFVISTSSYFFINFQTALLPPTKTQTASVTPANTNFFPTDTEISPSLTSAPVNIDASCPFYVYKDGMADVNKFAPEGFMGDISDIKLDDNYTLDHERSSVIQIAYKPDGEQQFAGIYWWAPGANWGNGDNVGFNISCANKLTFWARGEFGGEHTEFKIGGVKGNYSDSVQPALSTGPITLTNGWRQYSIDLAGKDLSYVIGGFVWVTNKPSNPNGAVIYLDDIRFEQ